VQTVTYLVTGKNFVVQNLYCILVTNIFSSASIDTSLLSLYCDNPLARNMFQQSCPIRAVSYSTFNKNTQFITIFYASNIKKPFLGPLTNGSINVHLQKGSHYLINNQATVKVKNKSYN
jgi:hypothetical protein